MNSDPEQDFARKMPAPLSVRRKWARVGKNVAYAVLVMYAIISLYPFVWMVAGATKNYRQVVSSVTPIPDATLSHFETTWTRLHFDTYLLNSIRVTGLALVLLIVVYPMAAYALAVMRFPMRGLIYGVFVAILFVPGISVLLPLILLEHSLGLLNTRVGLTLAYINGASPLAIMLLVNYIHAIPPELRQAAQMDGASEWLIFRRVYFPLLKPALAAVALILSVSFWNEYLFASVSITSSERMTLPIGLQQVLSATVVHWNNVMAGSTIIVLPVIIVFLIGQRYFFDGLTGALKG